MFPSTLGNHNGAWGDPLAWKSAGVKTGPRGWPAPSSIWTDAPCGNVASTANEIDRAHLV